MSKESNFKQVVQNFNSGMKVPVMSLVRENPELAAMISKFVKAPLSTATYGADGRREAFLPNTYSLHTKSQRTTDNINDAETVMQMLPDIELAAQILVSSILSPKDMMTTELTYTVKEGILAADVVAALVSVARSYFENDYKIKTKLSEMLRDMLFETGSYPIAVIPENSLDEVINGSRRMTLESFNSAGFANGAIPQIGLLGPVTAPTPTVERTTFSLSTEDLNDAPVKFAFDPNASKVAFRFGDSALATESFLSVCDNPDLLKIPQVHERIRYLRTMTAIKSPAMKYLNTSLESFQKTKGPGTNITDRELTGRLFKSKQGTYRPIATLKTQDQLNRSTVGHPLIMHLPSESVIPVHVPGSPEIQVGFFILLDAEGNPVRKSDQSDYYRQLETRMQSNGNFATAMLGKLNQMTQGGFNSGSPDDLDLSARVYGEMVEADLLARLRNGIYGKGVAIARRDEVYRIMLARTLAQQQTQLLFLPAELVTYFAFKYNPDGVGKSLLEDLKIINSLRAMLTFSNVMASLKNSIGRTAVSVKLDESDPNPQKTIEIAMHEIVRSRSNSFPIGLNKPTDLVDFLQRASYEIGFEGHPGLPDVKVDFTEKNSNYVKPDTDLEDSLRKRSIMGLGLSPENIDAGFTAEFATSILHNNLLLSKRVMQMQQAFTPLLSDHLRKVMFNSEHLMEKFRDVLRSNFASLKTHLTDEAKEQLSLENAAADVKEGKTYGATETAVVEYFIHQFITGFDTALPQPNSVTLENQMQAFDVYIEGLDKVLDAYISDSYFTNETGGNVANDVIALKALVKSYFIRNWLAENGVMPEIASLTTVDSEGKSAANVFEATESHVAGLMKSLTGLMVKLEPLKKKSNDKLEAAGATSDDTGSTTDDTSGDGGAVTDEGGLPGFDDGGAGEDTGAGGDTTAVDGTTATPVAGGGEEGSEASATGSGEGAEAGADKT